MKRQYIRPHSPRVEKYWGGEWQPVFSTPLRKTTNDPAPQKNATSQSRVKARGNRSLNALRLGGTVKDFDKVLLCCGEANSIRSAHALLDTGG